MQGPETPPLRPGLGKAGSGSKDVWQGQYIGAAALQLIFIVWLALQVVGEEQVRWGQRAELFLPLADCKPLTFLLVQSLPAPYSLSQSSDGLSKPTRAPRVEIVSQAPAQAQAHRRLSGMLVK